MVLFCDFLSKKSEIFFTMCHVISVYRPLIRSAEERFEKMKSESSFSVIMAGGESGSMHYATSRDAHHLD